jgi:hypothetical protein
MVPAFPPREFVKVGVIKYRPFDGGPLDVIGAGLLDITFNRLEEGNLSRGGFIKKWWADLCDTPSTTTNEVGGRR